MKFAFPAIVFATGASLVLVGLATVLVQPEVSSEILDSNVNSLGETWLALDSLGQLHVTYNSITPSMLKYAVKRGGQWNYELVDSAGWKHCFRLDAGDRPHIVYVDFDSKDLHYATKNEDEWVKETLADSMYATALYLTLDSNKKPHICYVAYSWIRYIFKENDAWVAQNVVAGDSPSVALALGKDNLPHIVYRERTSGTNCLLKHAFKSEGNWTTETVATYEAEGFQGLETFCLEEDDAGNLHISYPSQDGLKYAIKHGDAWTIETVDPINIGTQSCLVLDSSSSPHISYMGRNNSPNSPDYFFSVNYAYRWNSIWEVAPVAPAGTNAGKLLDTAMTLDTDGKPKIGYYVYEGEDFNLYSHDYVRPEFSSIPQTLRPFGYVFLATGTAILLAGIAVATKRARRR